MSKELELKSGTKKPVKLSAVRVTQDVTFFNLGGRQISSTMEGISLEWNGDVVVVRSTAFPGQEKWIFPACIAWVSYEELK